MVKEKVSFKEFQSAVAPEHQAFVDKLNNKLIELGCNLVIKEAKSSDTCVEGFVYDLDGGTYKKCRNDGMFFLLTNETAEHIAELICAEVTVRQSASQPQDS